MSSVKAVLVYDENPNSSLLMLVSFATFFYRLHVAECAGSAAAAAVAAVGTIIIDEEPARTAFVRGVLCCCSGS